MPCFAQDTPDITLVDRARTAVTRLGPRNEQCRTVQRTAVLLMIFGLAPKWSMMMDDLHR